MPEPSQVSSRKQRQCPAESRINLTGARTTNWRAFSRYPSARLAAIATDLLGNPHRLSSRSICESDGVLDPFSPSNSAMLAITPAATTYIFVVGCELHAGGDRWAA